MDEECVDLEYLRRQALNSVTPKKKGSSVFLHDRASNQLESEFGIDDLFGRCAKEKGSAAKKANTLPLAIPHNVRSERAEKLLSNAQVRKRTRCSRSPLPHKRSKRQGSTTSSASQYSSSHSRSLSESRSSYSSSPNSSCSFSRGSSSSYRSSYSHSGSSRSSSVSRSYSSSSRSRSASPKPISNRLKKPHLPNNKLQARMLEQNKHRKQISSDSFNTLLTQPPTKDQCFDKRFSSSKTRGEIRHQLHSPQLRYHVSSYKDIRRRRQRSPHSLFYHKSGIYSSKRDSREPRNVSHLSLSHSPPLQEKRVVNRIQRHLLSDRSKGRHQSQRHFPVPMSPPPTTHTRRYSVSPYHTQSQKSNQLRHENIKPKWRREQNQSKFNDHRRDNDLKKYPMTRNSRNGNVKAYSDSDRSKRSTRAKADTPTELKTSESKASNDTSSSNQVARNQDTIGSSHAFAGETANKDEQSGCDLTTSDLLGDYEFDVELDYNEEMDEFEVHTHEVAKKSNVEDGKDGNLGSSIVLQDKSQDQCDTGSVPPVDEQVVASSGDEIVNEAINSPIKVSPTHDRTSGSRVVRQTCKGPDSKLSVKERLYVDKRTIEEKRRRIVTESHPKLLSSLRPSLANRLGPSPLNNPSSRKSSDHTKRVFSREGGMKQKRFKGDAIAIAEAYRRRKRHEATDLWRDDEILEAKKLAKMINRAESDSKSSSKRTEHVTTRGESALDQRIDAIKAQNKAIIRRKQEVEKDKQRYA